MKKIVSSLLALMLLLSGMHLSVASHYCGGMLAQVKWSFIQELAGCGMEGEHNTKQGVLVDQSCCQDQISSYSTDGQYQIQSLELKKRTPQVLAFFTAPLSLLSTTQQPAGRVLTPVFPPGKISPNQVTQEKVCVFLI